MALDSVTPGLLVGWAANIKKWFAQNHEAREDDLQAISNVVGGTSLARLAEFYVEPEFQTTNPADRHDEDIPGVSGELRKMLNRFLGGEFHDRDGRQFLFVLADAGMGKSSLLAMLKLTHLAEHWGSKIDFKLLKLGRDTLEVVEAIRHPKNTVLLLDSLDEDATAQGRIQERLLELFHKTKNFRQIIITCRTQFFPKGEASSIEQLKGIKIEGFECNLIYLTPFSNEQVETYLLKLFPNPWWRKLIGRPNPKLVEAKKKIDLMLSLRMRPMLLAKIEDLMDANVEEWNEYTVFQILVEKWFDREKRRALGLDLTKLQEACQILAVHLQMKNERLISAENLATFAEEQPALSAFQPMELEGQALLNRNSDGAYRFAHYSVQEFFVIKALKEGLVTEKPFTRTEMLERFGALADVRVQVKARGAILDSEGAYLFQANLKEAHLFKANLIGSYLVKADFRKADLRFTSCMRANLSGAGLRGANLRGANLSDARLQGADLQGANLQDADLQGSKLHDGYLLSTDLQHGDLQGAYLSGADLRGANLSGANLSDVRLRGVNLSDAKLHYADLHRADLQGANLQGANLQGANLQGADLQGADLEGARLQGADLQGADLQGADLQGADFQGADLQGATLQDGYLLSTDLQGANLQGADLTNTKIFTQHQLNPAKGDKTTKLPEGLKYPDHWLKGDD